MKTLKLIDASALASLSGDVNTPEQGSSNKDKMIVHADFSATGTVVIEGRVDSDLGWFTLQTITDADPALVELSLVPQVRARITANTGTISVSCAV